MARLCLPSKVRTDHNMYDSDFSAMFMCIKDLRTCSTITVQMLISPSSSRGWLGTEGPAGCSDPRERPTGRRDSSLRLYPHSSGGLRETENIYTVIHTHTLKRP